MAENKGVKKLRAQDQREIQTTNQRAAPQVEGPGVVSSATGTAKKVGCLLLGGRGRLTSRVDRLKAIKLLKEANTAGVSLFSACLELLISLRFLKCWRCGFKSDGS